MPLTIRLPTFEGPPGQGNEYLNDKLVESGNEGWIDNTSPTTVGPFTGHRNASGQLQPTQNFGNLDSNMIGNLVGTKDPGMFPIFNGANAYDTAWNVHNYQTSLRDSLYDPLLTDTAGQVGNSNMVQSAFWDTAIQQARSQGISERNRERYGQNLSPAMQEYQRSSRVRDNALQMSNNVNNARLDEYEYDNSLRRGMINIGRQQMNDAAAGAGIASGSQAQRETAGDAAQAAHKAQQQQNAAAAASAILTIAVLAK